ncbi:penicillin-binding protein 2 [Burkholderiales bacterium]|nr:MAG: penicillin-binding protein 2 [Burkholderiales bacterium]CAG0987166.1 penicillin-binding protein 2 [Burkholderiales bacterium]
MKHTEIKNPERELFLFRRRLAIAAVLVLVAFLALLARFVFLQVVKHEEFRTLAESNRISILPVVPNRGIIADRNGVVLANNYSAYTIEITPSKVKSIEATLDDLSAVIEVTARDRKRFKKLLEESKNFESLPIRTRLTDEEVARFAANRFRFPGVEIKARLFRQYPFGEIASHVLGYIGRINDKDLERIARIEQQTNYKGTDYIGKVGIELSYEHELHGSTGVEEVEIDAGGRAVRTLSRTAPTSGNNLRLSLDIKLQQFAEELFADRRGALVAIEPATGDLLAFVSKPGYDPNLFVEGIDTQNWETLNTSPDKPLLNRPMRGAYPPGSTFKPFMALFALEHKKRTPEQGISDPGYFTLGNHTWRDDKKGGHGWVDMYNSIVHSCDTYYYKLGSESDIDEIHAFMRQFSFGQPTGVDIEGELSGVLPSREWKRERFKRDPKWQAGDSVSAAIGQGFNTFTPLQLAVGMATLANDGVAFRPHLVKAIENVKSGEVRYIAPQPSHRVALKESHLQVIKRAMVGVNKEGTGARAFAGAPYASGGKTGTAQVIAMKEGPYDASKVEERFRDHAWFIAYAPAEKPRIALAVLVENAGFGAQHAAPIARQVFDYYLLGKAAAPATTAALTAPTRHD